MVIYSGFTHWKWWCSIVMLVYQRVDCQFLFSKKVPSWWDCHCRIASASDHEELLYQSARKGWQPDMMHVVLSLKILGCTSLMIKMATHGILLGYLMGFWVLVTVEISHKWPKKTAGHWHIFIDDFEADFRVCPTSGNFWNPAPSIYCTKGPSSIYMGKLDNY
jgi:hypothetical protein